MGFFSHISYTDKIVLTSSNGKIGHFLLTNLKAKQNKNYASLGGETTVQLSQSMFILQPHIIHTIIEFETHYL